MRLKIIQMVRNRRYLQSIEFVISCGRDTRIKQRDAFKKRIFFDVIFWNLCPLFKTGRTKRKMIRKGRVTWPYTRKKVTKMLTKIWLKIKVCNDFISFLLIVVLIFLGFSNAKPDDNLHHQSEEESCEKDWYKMT